jgi:ribosomal protein S18 acetylase RimI-like enzyme
MKSATALKLAIRPLTRDDLDAVVAIDGAIEGRSRRDYIQRRLKAALLEPKLHAQFGATDENGFCGHILARVLEGEFGRSEPGLRIEIVGVRRDAQGRGVGRQLFDTLCEWARRHGIHDLRTKADWNNHPMMRWIDAMGFTLAPNLVVDCAVDGGQYTPKRDDAITREAAPRDENDFSQPGGDFERLARDSADVRSMQAEDLAEIVRIDSHITGRNRESYIKTKLAEALSDSAIRVSLTARLEGILAGYLMARTDLGDFGRTEPVAVIDTIGVDPGFTRRGVAHALLSQLFVNLGALRIERVETVVAPRDFALLGFLYDVGFMPSQRLAFVRRLN